MKKIIILFFINLLFASWWGGGGGDDGGSSSTTGESNSTDGFAVRPYKYEINVTTPQPIKAGSEFNVTIRALDYNGNSAKDYNETINIKGNSPDLNYSDLNCKSGKLNSLTSLTFKDGEANFTLTYSEVGEVNLSIEEFNDSNEFASVDENDTNETLSKLLIESNYLDLFLTILMLI